MFLENSYVPRNTLVHNLNPLIKFVIFLSIVFLLFLKITFSVQFFLFIFVGLVVWKSDCFYVVKRSIPLFFILFAFLYVVNFFFMKSPGFWTDNLLNYESKDLFGIIKLGNPTGDRVSSGWYYGGEILKKSDETIWMGNLSEIEAAKNNAASAFANYSADKKWVFTPITINGVTQYVAFSPVWYTVSSLQVVRALSLAFKIVLIIILSSIFTITISLSSFTYALEDLLRPLKIFRLPTEIMALSAAISIRFVPSLIGEAFRIIRAQASRGIDYKNGKLKDKASALLSLFVPLFVISFIKAGELSEAMTARGYKHGSPRSSLRIHIVKTWELIILFFSVCFIAMQYYFFCNGYYFGFFSTFEYLTFVAR